MMSDAPSGGVVFVLVLGVEVADVVADDSLAGIPRDVSVAELVIVAATVLANACWRGTLR